MNGESRVYGWLEKRHAWLVNYIDDPGLYRSMEALKIVPQNFGGKVYWRVDSNEEFQRVRPLLETLGYREYVEGEKKESAPPVESAQEHTYSVTELNGFVRGVFKDTFSDDIWLRGEISGLGHRAEQVKGHLYFDLVEASGSETFKISAAIWLPRWRHIFAQIASGQLPELRDGTEIRVLGRPTYYDRGGSVTFSILQIDKGFAEGEFLKRKHEIYQKLVDMGIHDQNRKLPMPDLPLRLAVFSNEGAAGYGDMMRQLSQSHFPYRATLFRVALQGRDVEPTFRAAFDLLESMGIENFDVGIIVRGGGSVTDLAAFNNEWLAEKVARSPLKFLVGIGHDRDTTVVDEIGMRMITPTDVGDRLNGILEAHEKELGSLRDDLVKNARQRVGDERERLIRIGYQCSADVRSLQGRARSELDGLRHAVDRAVHDSISSAGSLLDNLRWKIEQAYHTEMSEQKSQLESYRRDILCETDAHSRREMERLRGLARDLAYKAHQRMQTAKYELEHARAVVDANDPRRLFELGYVMMSDDGGRLLKSARAVQPGQHITVRMADGHLTATVGSVTCDEQGDKNGK